MQFSCVIILNLGLGTMSFLRFSIFKLWQPFVSCEWNHLCNFCRRHYGEHWCDIMLNVEKCGLKNFLI